MDPSALGGHDLGFDATEEEQVISSYVALGDSFTAGTGCDPGLCWADRLAKALPGRVAYRNLAVHGATSTQVREQVGQALQLEPDLVTVVCGTNDVLFTNNVDVLTYSRNFGGILRMLQRVLPGVRILTATAPERWDFLKIGPRTRAKLEQNIKRINQATRSLAAAHNVAVLEVADNEGLSDPENFSPDGLHPSPLGHAKAALGFAALLREHYGIELNEEVLGSA
ncbi:MAG TPA: SGNH/GDSL hydrolase family protein [Solirubrobacterales bacterium]|jgi:lysophospholipase L1-like esterase